MNWGKSVAIKPLATDVFLLSFFSFVIKVQSIYMRVWHILKKPKLLLPCFFWCSLNHIPFHVWELHAVALQINNYCGLLKKSTTLKTTHSNRYLYFCTVFKIKDIKNQSSILQNLCHCICKMHICVGSVYECTKRRSVFQRMLWNSGAKDRRCSRFFTSLIL